MKTGTGALIPVILAPTRKGSAAPAWTPAQITGLSHWYTADPAYCFSDAGGTTPCNVGDQIQVWKNRFGTTANFSQATASLRPTLQQQGGKYVARFDGADDAMTGGPNLTGASSLFAIEFPVATAANRRTINSATVNALIAPSRTNSGSQVAFWGTNVATATGIAAAGAWQTAGVTWGGSGNCKVYRNGTDVSLPGTPTAAWGNVTLGASGVFTEAAGTDVRHLVFGTSAFSAADVVLLSTYGSTGG